ncbi:MAG: WG repeat-containing protein [Clostridia bacterium]|nr:WG repeat-containing protein [Clostridia bacterium]
MKRIILLILSILFTLTACAEKTTQAEGDTEPSASEATYPTLPPPELTGDEDTFYLSYLPDIGEYEAEDAPERWFPDYVGELIPSEEYGELIPYLGYEKEFSLYAYGDWQDWKQRYYGLCTTDGVIVTDPVYSAVYMGEDGYYILKGQPAEVELEYYSDYLYPFYIAKSDGSEVVSLSSPAAVCGHFAEDIYFTRTSYVDESGWKMYSASGELLLEYRQDDIYFYIPTVHGNGTVSVKSEGTEYFVDSRFQCTSAIFKSITYIGEDLYIVEELSGKYGVIDIDGRYVVAAEYDYLTKADNGFYAVRGGEIAITDREMNVQTAFPIEHGVNEIIARGEKVICIDAGVWEDYFYDTKGNILPFSSVIPINDEYYLMTSMAKSVLADSDLNEVASFQNMQLQRNYSDILEGYFCFFDSNAVDYENNDVLYSIESGDITTGIHRIYYDYYETVASDGTITYYDFDGNPIEKPQEEESGESETEPTVEKEETDTPYGKITMYIDGDYAYTEDAEGNIIVKRRAAFD